MMPLSGWDSCSEPCPPLWQLPKNTLLNSVFHGIDGKDLSHPHQSLFWETCKHHSFPVSPLGVELKPPNFLQWPCLQTLTLNWPKRETVPSVSSLSKTTKIDVLKAVGMLHMSLWVKKRLWNSIKLLYYIWRKNTICMYIHHTAGPHKNRQLVTTASSKGLLTCSVSNQIWLGRTVIKLFH